MSVIVIGSGPAGVAVTRALVDAGQHVTMIDAGDTIEPGRMEIFESLLHDDHSQPPPQLTQMVRDAFPVSTRHVPLKPSYGSLFPYALDDADLPIAREHAETLPSLARGGLSNSWGASILPFRRSDIDDWPVSLDELEPHYRAVLQFMPIAGERDALSDVLPLYTDRPDHLQRSRQTERILTHMRSRAADMQAAGLRFGASRLAVNASTQTARACRYTGLCMYGCPYQSIYNAAHTLDELVRCGRLDYRPGLYVDRLSQEDDSVIVHLHPRKLPRQTHRLTASRVFVACGPISSTRLVLDSLGHAPSHIRLLDSQYFLLPMLTRYRAEASAATQGNTLAQIFLELEDPRISRYTVHLQVYGYNDLMLSALAGRAPLPRAMLERMLGPIVGRVVVIQGYLHSTDSAGLTMHWDRRRVRLVGDAVTRRGTPVCAIVRRLLAARSPLGMLPAAGLLQIGSPGKSNHLGGSLPMRRRPGHLETDTLGRLSGWEQVHVVDASIFPSVPATTVTMSVMANAHRIGTAAASL
ncbi:MAG TPA: GMC oxidoreductase [Solirubrobacteraceae bacterium]|nr:GMC oxidoreductase [Solirubrobacteraceae bacterium]